MKYCIRRRMIGKFDLWETVADGIDCRDEAMSVATELAMGAPWLVLVSVSEETKFGTMWRVVETIRG